MNRKVIEVSNSLGHPIIGDVYSRNKIGILFLIALQWAIMRKGRAVFYSSNNTDSMTIVTLPRRPRGPLPFLANMRLSDPIYFPPRRTPGCIVFS